MRHKPRSRGKPPEPWAAFLKALDDLLEKPVDLHCIGGFVISMQYGLSRETADIDILPASPNERLVELQRFAGVGSDLHRRFKVYLQIVPIATYPEDYESRLVQMWPRFSLVRCGGAALLGPCVPPVWESPREAGDTPIRWLSETRL